MFDVGSRARYVLLPAEQFERLKSLVGAEDFDIRETYTAQEEVLNKAGWDDPEVDSYNDYDAHRS